MSQLTALSQMVASQHLGTTLEKVLVSPMDTSDAKRGKLSAIRSSASAEAAPS